MLIKAFFLVLAFTRNSPAMNFYDSLERSYFTHIRSCGRRFFSILKSFPFNGTEKLVLVTSARISFVLTNSKRKKGRRKSLSFVTQLIQPCSMQRESSRGNSRGTYCMEYIKLLFPGAAFSSV